MSSLSGIQDLLKRLLNLKLNLNDLLEFFLSLVQEFRRKFFGEKLFWRTHFSAKCPSLKAKLNFILQR